MKRPSPTDAGANVTPPSATSVKQAIVERAGELGFDIVRVASPNSASSAEMLQPWLDQGRHGEMSWLAKEPQRRSTPSLAYPGVRSILTVGLRYWQEIDSPELLSDPSRGRFARYAWGRDYHDLLTPRLRQLGSELSHIAGKPVNSRVWVDTGPMLERGIAADAGMGFIGKNTLLISRGFGSWLFLGELAMDLELEPDPPKRVSFGCGDCTLCAQACPTGALDEPYRMDARTCISYLTIELRGSIPRELRPRMGNWVFGCDLCQESCPYNGRIRESTREVHLLAADADSAAPKLLDLISLDEEGFKRRFRRRAVMRTKRRGLLRNVAVALGNWGSDEAAGPLSRALEDKEPLIRGHAAWALGRIGTQRAKCALEHRWKVEEETGVREELEAALSGVE